MTLRSRRRDRSSRAEEGATPAEVQQERLLELRAKVQAQQQSTAAFVHSWRVSPHSLHCIALYCIVLYCIWLIALYCTVVNYIVVADARSKHFGRWRSRCWR